MRQQHKNAKRCRQAKSPVVKTGRPVSALISGDRRMEVVGIV